MARNSSSSSFGPLSTSQRVAGDCNVPTPKSASLPVDPRRESRLKTRRPQRKRVSARKASNSLYHRSDLSGPSFPTLLRQVAPRGHCTSRKIRCQKSCFEPDSVTPPGTCLAHRKASKNVFLR